MPLLPPAALDLHLLRSTATEPRAVPAAPAPTTPRGHRRPASRRTTTASPGRGAVAAVTDAVGLGTTTTTTPPRPQGPSAASWSPGVNPWTGMVQAWQMPFGVPSAGILGSRPGAPPHQAYYTSTPSFPPAPPAPIATPTDVWNHQALLAALATANVPPSRPQTVEWYLDIGASSHMASNAGIVTNSQPLSRSPPIQVGNGAVLPVTHRAHTVIPTARSPLVLDNILVSPSLVKNLISVRSLTRDNNVTVEFDPFGFTVKDIPT